MATKTIGQKSVIHSTFVLERSYSALPERVFAGFSDAAKKRRWFVEGGGHVVEQFEMNFEIGGRESGRFRFKEGTPVAGLTCITESTYQDIVPNRRIVMASSMNIGGRCISASLITVEFLPAAEGTDLILTHQGAFFEGADGPEMREAGWRKLLDRFAAEVAG